MDATTEQMDELEIQLELGGDHLSDGSTTWNNESPSNNTSAEVRHGTPNICH